VKVEYIRTYLPNEENTQRYNKEVSHSYTIVKTVSTSHVIEFNPVHSGYTLSQNYPNPFNPETSIQYEIPRSNHVRVTIFDMLGREVAALVNQDQSAGTYTVTFHVQKYSGSSGMYYCRMTAGEYSKKMKMICLK